MKYHNLGGYLRRREVTAVLAARATPAMRLEVREVGPIETPRHQHTVYLPATMVPPTVVAPRPKRAEAVGRAQFPEMGIDPGRHQPMQILPSTHVKSPEAIITDEGEKSSRAQRAAPAAWRPVGRRLPRPLERASALSGAPIRPPAGPACRARRVGYAPPGGPSRAAGPLPRPAPRVADPSATTAATSRRGPRPASSPTSPWWTPGAYGAPSYYKLYVLMTMRWRRRLGLVRKSCMPRVPIGWRCFVRPLSTRHAFCLDLGSLLLVFKFPSCWVGQSQCTALRV